MDTTSISLFTDITNSTAFEDLDFMVSTEEAKVDLLSLPIVKARNLIRMIYLPFVIVFGAIGNVMTLIIVYRLRASRSSLDYYFVTMAVSDTCVIFTGPVRVWSGNVWRPFDMRQFNQFTCQLSLFLFNVASGVSTWILLVMVVQRALSVVWPHRVGVMCTAKRMWGIIAGVVIFFCLAYSHFWYGRIMKNGKCSYNPSYYIFLVDVFVKIDVFLFSVIPLVGLMIGNVVLVSKLKVSVKEAGEQFAASDKQQSQREKKVNSITLTALVLSTCFIIFTLPIAMYNALSFVSFTNDHNLTVEEVAVNYFTQAMLYNIFYLNYSLNFYLYCLTGNRFRNEFKKTMSDLVSCCRSPRT